METDEESHRSYWDDGSSITSVTTLTMTEGTSQMSEPPDVRMHLPLDMQESSKQSLQEKSLIDLTNTLSLNIEEFGKSFRGSNYMKRKLTYLSELANFIETKVSSEFAIDNVKNEEILCELKNEISKLEYDNFELKKQISKQNDIKHSNDTLNEYIDQSEEKHLQEVAYLKAQLSLTKLADDVKKSSKDLSTSSLNESSSIDGGMVTRKKKRRSSLKFWKKSQSDLSSPSKPNTPSEDENVTKEIALLVSEVADKAMHEKHLQIETLESEKLDLERQYDLLEKNMQEYQIEMSIKENRNKELNEENRKLKQQENKCAEIVKALSRKARNAIARAIASSRMTEEMREQVQQQYDNLARIEKHMQQLSIENKTLLTRLNKNSYDKKIILDEKSELITFLQEFVLDSINTTNLPTSTIIIEAKKILSRKKKNIPENKSTQTSSEKKKIRKSTSNADHHADSGVSFNDKISQHDFAGDKTRHCMDCQDTIHTNYLNWFAFLQANVGVEIEKYKKNILQLENENTRLKATLQRSERRDSHANQTRKRTGYGGKHGTYGSNALKNMGRCVSSPHNQFVGVSNHMTYGTDENDEMTPNNNLFLHSYEQGTAIIRNIIEGSDKNEHNRHVNTDRCLR